MYRLRGVLCLALSLLLVQVLAEEGHTRQDFGSESLSATDAFDSRLAQSYPLLRSPIEADHPMGESKQAADATGGAGDNNFGQDSISQSAESASQAFGDSNRSGASELHYDYKAAHRLVDKHRKRDIMALKLSLSFTMADSNQTVSDAICNAMNSSVTQLILTNLASTSKIFQVPQCLRASSLTYFSAEFFTTSSFTVFPTTLNTLYCVNCRFRRDYSDSSTPIASTPAALAADGFNTDGTINWTELFSTFSSLANIDFLLSSLNATLPSTLPARVTFLRLRGTALSGNLPTNLLSNIGAAATATSTLHFDIAYTLVTGTVSSTNLGYFADKLFLEMRLDYTGTQIRGSLTNFFSGLASANMQTFVAYFGANSNFLSGLPNFPSGIIRAGGIFKVDFTSCSLTGTIRDGWLEFLPSDAQVSLELSGNKLTGPLPGYVFSQGSAPSSLTLNLASNLLNGSLTGFIASSWSQNTTVLSSTVYLNNNQLTGTIPETLLLNYYTSKRDSNGDEGNEYGRSQVDSGKSSLTRSSSAAAALQPSGLLALNSFTLSLANNRLTGTVPSLLLSASFNAMGTLADGVTIDWSNNMLNGSVPSDLFAGLPAGVTGDITLLLNNNSFSGSIPAFCKASAALTIDMSLNNLTGSIPTSWTSCSMSQVTLNDNAFLSGSIPATLFTGTGISSFSAKNTSLTGFLPLIGSSLTFFDLSATTLEFCDSSSTASMTGYNATCAVDSTIACTCASSYAQCGMNIACPPGVIAPITPNTPTPSTCPDSTRPGPEFNCFNGRWTAAVVTAPVLNIPPGAGTVVVLGDVQSDSVIINDLSSNLEVDGCAANLTSVSLQLTKEQIEQIGSGTVTQTLISTSGSGCNNLNSVNLNAQVSNQGCKKLKIQKQVSPDGTSLAAVFSLQTSGCHTWWIILVSVICAVVIITVIVVVVLVVCCNCCKKKVRPFAGTEGNHPV